jgi:MFS transporter, DHA2 family, methylenomycin A resistance protein
LSEPASPAPVDGRLRPALWLIVFAGPALRTSLLGCLLVAEQALGQAFSLSAETLAILVEGALFGGLLAVFLVPPLVAAAGVRRVAAIATAMTLVCLVFAVAAAPLASDDARATVGLFVVTGLLGFFVALLSPISQTVLNISTMSNDSARHSLQSAWSAGQPAGFIVASLAGGILAEKFGWWATLTVPLGFALMCAVALLDRNIAPPAAHKTEGHRPSTSEIAWIVLALIAFEVWSTWGSLKSWLAPGVLASLAAAILITAVALNRTRRAAEPAISPKPFAAAGFAAATFILFIYQFPTTAEFEVLLLTQLGHMSADDIGTRTAIGNVGQIAGTALAAALLLRHRLELALTLGFALTIAGLGGYVLYPWWDGFIFTTVTRTIAGLGTGVLTPVLFVLALHRMRATLQVAAGTWLILALIGGTEVGLAVFDVVLKLVTEITGSTVAGYIGVESAQLICGIATALLTVWLVLRGSLPLIAGSETVSANPTHPA